MIDRILNGETKCRHIIVHPPLQHRPPFVVIRPRDMAPVIRKVFGEEPVIPIKIIHLHKILIIDIPSMYSFGFRSQRRLRKAVMFSFLSA